MSLSASKGHRFQNSLDMVAARSTLIVDLTQPSGTDNAWSMLDSPMMDSPILGRMSSFNKGKAIARDKPVPAPLSTTPINVAPLVIRKANVAPLDIKKIRRRGFMTGVQLDLPKTPQPAPRSPLIISTTAPMSPPLDTALTFTAEWDLTQRAFVFTPFEAAYPLSAASSHPTVSPIPDDVQSLADTVGLNERGDSLEDDDESPSPSSSATSPCSEIFDVDSVYSQDDSSSKDDCTAPSSASASSSPHALYSKPAASSSSFARQVTLNLFEEELHRVTSSESKKSDFDKGCYEEMDEDLLLAPMDVFHRMLYDTTEAEARRSMLFLNKSTSHLPTKRSTEESPLPPLGPGLVAVKPPSPGSLRSLDDTSSVSPSDFPSVPAVIISRHSRNLSFPAGGPRLRPKGPRRKRNFSADIAGVLHLKR
ncbi:hypothetical protein BXZ70DRAFT_1005948 [Cristinia sonorae]|uniref:Uncharacterized protein n=1 Tax=Cristinia sonorae TaxID=1940300 RepID=A0A8K0XSE4_9AGAR|nr:hypothetical protein BXZ70DRAFT_1005948 [Cristinia sonorae]